MGFVIIFAGIVGLGFLTWALIDAFYVEQRDSKGKGKQSI
jgi:uncharacterized membrane protein